MCGGLRCSTSRMELTGTGGEMLQGAVFITTLSCGGAVQTHDEDIEK